MAPNFFAAKDWDDDVPEIEQQEVLGQRMKLKKSKKKKDNSENNTIISNKNFDESIKSKKNKKRISETYIKYDSPEMNVSINNEIEPTECEKKKRKKNKKNPTFDNNSNNEFPNVDNIKSAVENVTLSKNQKKKLKKLKKNAEKSVNNDMNGLKDKEKTQNNVIQKEKKKDNERKIKNVAKKLLNSKEKLNNTSVVSEVDQSVNKNNLVAKSTNKKNKNKIKKQLKNMEKQQESNGVLIEKTEADQSVNKNNLVAKSTNKKNKNKLKKQLKKMEKQQESDGILIEKAASPVDDKNPIKKLTGVQKKSKPYMNKLKKLLDNVTIPVVDHSNDTKDIPDDILSKINESVDKESTKVVGQKSLRQRMLERIKGARFRYLNEQLYVSESSGANKIFKEDPDAFKAYHEGYRQQVSKWPLNPLDVIINDIKKLPKDHIIADLGCGDAKLAKSVSQKVYSFDLVALDPLVNACDMSHTPLLSSHVNIVVFCLSLMGTNLNDYLLEANRIMKIGGILKVAEVESRFENVDQFISDMKKYGFSLTKKDLNNNLFYFMDFKKDADVKKRNKLPQIALNPCLYKKR